jgi:lactate dehydrogenase-like 2-hydroxyacid dehydrogenase
VNIAAAAAPAAAAFSNQQVVSLHCNLDDNTRHLINKERLAMMKKDAVLVNAARGPCIDEAALVKHMQEHPDFRAGRSELFWVFTCLPTK